MSDLYRIEPAQKSPTKRSENNLVPGSTASRPCASLQDYSRGARFYLPAIRIILDRVTSAVATQGLTRGLWNTFPERNVSLNLSCKEFNINHDHKQVAHPAHDLLSKLMALASVMNRGDHVSRLEGVRRGNLLCSRG